MFSFELTQVCQGLPRVPDHGHLAHLQFVSFAVSTGFLLCYTRCQTLNRQGGSNDPWAG